MLVRGMVNFKRCVYLCTFVVCVCGTLMSCIYFSQGTGVR